jgi:3',5'-cyclic AMP phosphodiesterase CpdA
MFTLAHLSDPHLAPLPPAHWTDLIGKRITGYLNWYNKRHLIHNPDTLERVVADLKSQRPDHIAVTGDIANIALATEYTRGRDWLDSLGPARDVTFVPGNHDIYVREAAALAARQWGAQMCDDDGTSAFPFIRRRGPLALIGLSSAVPTAPFMATGWLGTKQLVELSAILNALKQDNLFRVLLIHHPPVSAARRFKRLLDAAVLLKVVAAHGVDLVIHGHDHETMLNWLDGPGGTRIPAVGVPSASAAPGRSKADAAYNLYRINDTAAGERQCEIETRGVNANGDVVTIKRVMLPR